MKTTTIGALLGALLITIIAACSYQEGTCWAPGEDPSIGAGGGPILPPGQGGFGLEEPEAESQDAATIWACEGDVVNCSNMKDPHVRSCFFMTGVGASKEAAIAQMYTKCEEALIPNSETAYICEDIKNLKCSEAPVPKYSCSGTARCKRGNRCYAPDEVWYNTCQYTDVPVYDLNPQNARQQLLLECQEELNESVGKGPWFCMPGTIVCKSDE